MIDAHGGLLTTPMMTPMERQMGRFMRAPDHPGEQAPAGASDNATVIPPTGAASESGGDNAGAAFDPEQFWKPAADSNPAPEAGAEAQALGNQLTTTLKEMTFGAEVIDQTVAAELADGKYENFNARLVEHSRQVARQTISANLQILKAVEAQIMRKADERIAAALGDRDNQADLFAAIPSAKNPAIRPQIQRIYDQALTNSAGDKKKAMDMTKTMARMLAETMAPDVGLSLSPRNPGDSAPAAPTNWMDELLGKS